MQNGKDGTQMKATGIVRRIDELGRVVIPKEIRRTQRIRRGDPLEIFTTGDGEVIFKKYSPVGELHGVAVQYAEVLSRSFALTAFVADRDRILAAAGSGRRDLADRSVSQPLEKVMESRKPYLSEGDPERVLLPCEGSLRPLLCAWPIIAAGDVTGAVGLLAEDRTQSSPTPPSRRLWPWRQRSWQSRWKSEHYYSRGSVCVSGRRSLFCL